MAELKNNILTQRLSLKRFLNGTKSRSVVSVRRIQSRKTICPIFQEGYINVDSRGLFFVLFKSICLFIQINNK